MCCKYEVAFKNLHSDKSPWNAHADGRDTPLWEQSIIIDQKKSLYKVKEAPWISWDLQESSKRSVLSQEFKEKKFLKEIVGNKRITAS